MTWTLEMYWQVRSEMEERLTRGENLITSSQDVLAQAQRKLAESLCYQSMVMPADRCTLYVPVAPGSENMTSHG